MAAYTPRAAGCTRDQAAAAQRAPRCPVRDAGTPGTAAERWTWVAVALLALPTLLAPLSPPMAWDELAYHLPHAREWARSGRLVVTEVERAGSW